MKTKRLIGGLESRRFRKLSTKDPAESDQWEMKLRYLDSLLLPRSAYIELGFPRLRTFHWQSGFWRGMQLGELYALFGATCDLIS